MREVEDGVDIAAADAHIKGDQSENLTSIDAGTYKHEAGVHTEDASPSNFGQALDYID